MNSKFQIFANIKQLSENCCCEKLPFFPKYKTHYILNKHLRVTWFETSFCQSNYSLTNITNGSNACTLIAILTATKCYYNRIKIESPEEPLDDKIIYALACAMLTGNDIHQALRIKGALSNINLTVPEAIHHAADKVTGIREWKSELHPQPLALTLYQNLKRVWKEWHFYCNKKNNPQDLYVILICDHRSVLFIIQNNLDTVTLVDSHQHSKARGALIATVNSSRLKLLCRWFSDLIYHCYESYPQVYELALLYFKSKN